MSNSPEIDNPEKEQSLLSHLVELRERLIRSLVSVLVVFLCLALFASDIYELIASPLLSQATVGSGDNMIATGVTSPFLVPFKLTIFVAIYICVPYILYQAWSFVVPGLYDTERTLMYPLMVSSILLFYLGTCFAFFVVFPLLFEYIPKFIPAGVAYMPDISNYLNFILKLFFAFGMAFEVPIATILLAKSGIISIESMAGKRPYIIVGAFCIGMLLTPPDPISQALLAVPIWLLFEAGLFLAKFFVANEDMDEEDDIDTNE